jgi:hypothetical protein
MGNNDYGTLATEAFDLYGRLFMAREETCNGDNPTKNYARIGRIITRAYARFERRDAMAEKCDGCGGYFCKGCPA